MKIVIKQDGTLHCVYDEAIELCSLGNVTITRGSHVEPDAQGFWFADLSPVSGPTLGPFKKRNEALQAERQWLEENWLSGQATANSTDSRIL